MGVPPLQFTPPLIHWLPCAWVCFGDICMSYGDFSCMFGSLGVFPHLLGVPGGIITWYVHMLISVHFVVPYVSCLYYSYYCYSSSYSGIFWPVISDRGSFPDRVSGNLGSAWSGSTTTLDAKRLGRCYWPCLCATAATSHLQCLLWLMPIILWVLHR